MSTLHIRFGIIFPRDVKLRICRRNQPIVLDIRRYPDNRPPRPLPVERGKSQLPTKRVFLRKHFVRQRFTENYRILGRRPIFVSESAPADDTNPESREIIWRYHTPAHHSASPLRGTHPTRYFDGSVKRSLHAARRRKRVTQRQVRHTGNSLEPCFHIVKERELLRGIRIAARGQGNLRRDDRPSLEAQRNALNAPETPQQQSRAGEENHRAGNLSRDQEMSYEPAPSRAGRARRPSGERFGSRIDERRRQTEQDARKQRNGDSESKYAKIERCLVQAHNSLGCDGDESLKQ